MVVAGFTRDLAAEAAIHSYSVEEVKTFVEAQMHEVRSFRDILRVGLPIELAKEWLDLGFEPMVIGRLVRFGWTPSAAVEALGPIPREQRSRAAWNLDRLST